MSGWTQSKNRVQIVLTVLWALVLVVSVFALAISIYHAANSVTKQTVLQQDIKFARRVVQPGLEENFDVGMGDVLYLANTWLDALVRISDLMGITVLLAIFGLILQRTQARSANKKNGDNVQGQEDHS
jgi:hypothetical protein